MLVAYAQGDIFLPALRPGSWQVGETRRCEIASRGSLRPDKGRDLLLCGDTTQLAWSQTWLRGDIRNQIYDAAKALKVSFHSAGHSGRKGTSPWWQCGRTSEGIDCE
jgi:hypothetical protein